MYLITERATATITAKQAARATAAHQRHTNPPTRNGWTVSPGGIVYAAELSDPELLKLSFRAADYTIKARLKASQAQLFRQLANSWKQEEQAWNIADYNIQAAELKAEAQTDRATATTARNKSNRIRQSQQSRTQHKAKVAQAAADAESKSGQAAELEKLTSTTGTDRGDLITAAAAAFWGDIMGTDQTARFYKPMCAAAHAESHQLSHPDSMTRSDTQSREISPAEYITFLDKYSPQSTYTDPRQNTSTTAILDYTQREQQAQTPTRQTATGKHSYCTVKHTTDPKTGKTAFFKVYHYFTVASYQTFSSLTAGGEIETIEESRNILIQSQASREHLTELFNRWNLTQRERAICFTLASDEAQQAAQQAAEDYNRERAEKAAKASTPKAAAEIRAKSNSRPAYLAAMWDTAFNINGIYDPASRRQIKSRLTRKAKEEQAHPQPLETAEQAHKHQKQIAAEMSRNKGTTASTRAAAGVDLLSWTDSPSTSTRPAHASGEYIRWTDSQTDSPSPILYFVFGEMLPRTRAAHNASNSVECFRAIWEQEQAAEQAPARAAQEIRNTLRAAAEQTRTAYQSHNAAAAALVFWDSLSQPEREQAAADAATATAEAYTAKAARLDSLTASYAGQIDNLTYSQRHKLKSLLDKRSKAREQAYKAHQTAAQLADIASRRAYHSGAIKAAIK